MLSPLKHPVYRNLFLAQVCALLGKGLATIALGLLAHDLAGAQAGEILGFALAIKMICYVGVAPIAGALAASLPRKMLLVGLDVARAGVAFALPFVTEAWQIYGLMAVLYVCSAAFTPSFQAMIPDVLADEAEYTKALSLSRLASDLENVASPVLAAALLSVLPYHDLFAGTGVGFLLSAALVVAVVLPKLTLAPRLFVERVTRGLRLFALTPRLRALVALSLASAAGGGMVFVNTVVLVQSRFGLGERQSAWALAAFGLGSMAAALVAPRVLERISDRSALFGGSWAMTGMLLIGSVFATSYASLLGIWFALGFGYALTLLPIGRVLRRSSHAEDRPALFAAHFAVSHAAWLVAYPSAGFVSAALGPQAAFVVLALLCIVGAGAAHVLWPRHDPENIPHTHADLPPDHPHFGQGDHVHPYIVDDLHTRWPRRTASD